MYQSKYCDAVHVYPREEAASFCPRYAHDVALSKRPKAADLGGLAMRTPSAALHKGKLA